MKISYYSEIKKISVGDDDYILPEPLYVKKTESGLHDYKVVIRLLLEQGLKVKPTKKSGTKIGEKTPKTRL